MSPKPQDLSEQKPVPLFAGYASTSVAVIALMYAMLAGLHTVQDFDLGWQLASGRWVVQHHRIFSTDVFSYTAAGQPWVYPALSGAIFYLGFLAGGYALLSWIGALACAGTVALLLRRNGLAASTLALLAVPLIANRTQPRAEMFTTVLFAAFLSLLWGYFRTGRSRLWLLPLLMVLWVNLHLGFVAGLGLCGAYVVLEVLDLSFAAKRASAAARLGRAWPWLALTIVATFLNPWGPSIYGALLRQERAQTLHNLWVVEWGGLHPSLASMHQASDLRDPQSSFWWLIAAALAGVCIAIWRKHWSAACLLAGSVYIAFQHVRLQALFACVVVVVGGALIEEAGHAALESYRDNPRVPHRSDPNRQLRNAAALLGVIGCLGRAGLRAWDLVSDRYYLRSTQLSLFGTGLSWWYPERAVDFLQHEKLPANIFNGYSLGGYLTWRLFPAYRDYIDSRAIPFGPQLFFRAYDLTAAGPDSSAWRQEADTHGINTIIVPLSRYQGMTLFPQLHAFCRSRSWSAVYMDEVSAIFVRRTPQTESTIERLQIDCETIQFNLPSDLNTVRSARAQARLFNAWENAGGILYSLERYPEALSYLDRAESRFQESASLHLLRALVFQQMNRGADAEREFHSSLNLEPTNEAWFDLGLFYMTQKRYAEAADVFRQSAESSSRPHERWMMLGQADLQLHQPKPALAAFEKADASSPFRNGGEEVGARFNSLIATGRAKACYQLGDLAQAVSFQEDAVKLEPGDAKLWLGLADLYDAQGRTAEAAQARTRAVQP